MVILIVVRHTAFTCQCCYESEFETDASMYTRERLVRKKPAESPKSQSQTSVPRYRSYIDNQMSANYGNQLQSSYHDPTGVVQPYTGELPPHLTLGSNVTDSHTFHASSFDM